jgi:hypothetical protein
MLEKHATHRPYPEGDMRMPWKMSSKTTAGMTNAKVLVSQAELLFGSPVIFARPFGTEPNGLNRSEGGRKQHTILSHTG